MSCVLLLVVFFCFFFFFLNEKQVEFFLKRNNEFQHQDYMKGWKCLGFQTGNPPRLTHGCFTFVTQDNRCFR